MAGSSVRTARRYGNRSGVNPRPDGRARRPCAVAGRRGRLGVLVGVPALLLVGATVVPGTAAQAASMAGPALAVDAAADQHPISPDIYGLNFADPKLAAELRLPVDRWGGNRTT